MKRHQTRSRTLLALLLLALPLLVLLLIPVQAGQASSHLLDWPLILPFHDPPGPDTWLLGQTYGNTTGAYFQRNTTYRFGQGIHFGIDLSARCGTPVVAVADGVVALVDAKGYGSAPHNLIIDHPQLKYSTLYGHLLEKPKLAVSQKVQQGDVVALSGDPDETCTGRPHLHLELRDYPGRSRFFNPIPLMRADWDNLALIGNFGRGFERDLDDTRKWQHLDDQPAATVGQKLLNDFRNPWPRTR